MLRMKAKYREITHPCTGRRQMSPYPLTREEALAENISKYLPYTPCPTHSHLVEGKTPVVYTLTDIKSCCAQYDSVDEYNAAVTRGEPTDPGKAHAMGLDYYWTPVPHRGCGHVGKLLLNGKCFTCNNQIKLMSPRQLAISSGQSWYMPVDGDLCPQGHLALRRVINGSCKRCEEERKATGPLPMYKDPALAATVIDRESARTLGLKYYRTGEACERGHTGWRYVSNATCIECIKGKGV